MVSPWPPSTKAVTFSTDTFSSRAMKVRKRAESSTPALRDTLDDVHQHDVAQLLLHRVLGDGGADVARAHHGDLGTRAHLQFRHVLDDGRAELRALHFLGAVHEPREVVGDDLLLDRLL